MIRIQQHVFLSQRLLRKINIVLILFVCYNSSMNAHLYRDINKIVIGQNYHNFKINHVVVREIIDYSV